jgi:hypothetical protein
VQYYSFSNAITDLIEDCKLFVFKLSANDILQLFYQQDPKLTVITYSHVYTLTVVLGIIGGFLSIIFGSLPVIMWFYQMFHYESKLILNLYKDASQTNSNPLDLKDKIEKTLPIRIGFTQYAKHWLLAVFCRCCRSQSKSRVQYDKYRRARKRMEHEFDFLEVVKRVRLLSLLTSALFAHR